MEKQKRKTSETGTGGEGKEEVGGNLEENKEGEKENPWY